MKTKEDILEQMRIEMPFNFPERIKPYVMEAMDIYALESCKEALKNASENAKYTTEDIEFCYRVTIDKQSIINEKNIPEI